MQVRFRRHAEAEFNGGWVARGRAPRRLRRQRRFGRRCGAASAVTGATTVPTADRVGARRAPEQHELYRARSHAGTRRGHPRHARVSRTQLHEPGARAPGARRRFTLVHRRASRPDPRVRQCLERGREQPGARHRQQGGVRRRARLARDGLRPAVRTERPGVPLLHPPCRHAAAVGARRVHEPGRRLDAQSGQRADPAHRRQAPREPQRRTSRVRAGRDAVRVDRGRRFRRRS